MSGRSSGWRDVVARIVGVVLLVAMVGAIGAIADAQNQTRQPGGRVLLPSQNGQAGKVLTTDGSQLSWGVSLPTQTGANAGQFLTTNGTSASWASTTITPATIWYDPVKIIASAAAGCGGSGDLSTSFPYTTFQQTPVVSPNQVTVGNYFTVLTAGHVTGGTFWTEDPGIDHVVALWCGSTNAACNTPLATCTVPAATVTTSGKYSCTFSTSVAVNAFLSYGISVHTADQHATAITNCSTGTAFDNPPLIGGSTAIWGGPNVIWQQPATVTVSGAMGKPTSANTTGYPVTFTWTVP